MLLTQLIIPSYVTRTPCLENRQRPINHLHPNINNFYVFILCVPLEMREAVGPNRKWEVLFTNGWWTVFIFC